MSFDYNPYKHIELVEEKGYWSWHCHGCGGDSEYDWDPDHDYLQPIIDDYRKHLLNSHKRTPEDFENWSTK